MENKINKIFYDLRKEIKEYYQSMLYIYPYKSIHYGFEEFKQQSNVLSFENKINECIISVLSGYKNWEFSQTADMDNGDIDINRFLVYTDKLNKLFFFFKEPNMSFFYDNFDICFVIDSGEEDDPRLDSHICYVDFINKYFTKRDAKCFFQELEYTREYVYKMKNGKIDLGICMELTGSFEFDFLLYNTEYMTLLDRKQNYFSKFDTINKFELEKCPAWLRNFYIAEWLYFNCDFMVGLDNTFKISGYLKSVEMLIYELLISNFGKKFDCKTAMNTTLGAMTKFISELPLVFFDNNDNLKTDYIQSLESWYKKIRNGYFHKHELLSLAEVVKIREETKKIIAKSLCLFEDNQKYYVIPQNYVFENGLTKTFPYYGNYVNISYTKDYKCLKKEMIDNDFLPQTMRKIFEKESNLYSFVTRFAQNSQEVNVPIENIDFVQGKIQQSTTILCYRFNEPCEIKIDTYPILFCLEGIDNELILCPQYDSYVFLYNNKLWAFSLFYNG